MSDATGCLLVVGLPLLFVGVALSLRRAGEVLARAPKTYAFVQILAVAFFVYQTVRSFAAAPPRPWYGGLWLSFVLVLSASEWRRRRIAKRETKGS